MPMPEDLKEVLELIGTMDRTDRMNTLLDYADQFQEVPQDVATRPFPEEHRVQRCESEAFVWAQPDAASGNQRYLFAVENPNGVSAKALAVILDQTASGQPLAEVAQIPSDIVFDIFGREISMGRGEGLMGMVTMVSGAARREAATRDA